MDLISREDVMQARPVWRNEEVKYETEEAIKELSVEYLGDSERIIKAKKMAISALSTEGNISRKRTCLTRQSRETVFGMR